jgi:mono/diheme cytochrome c family protein
MLAAFVASAAGRPRSPPLVWFRRLALVGLLFNASFVASALFAPDAIRRTLGAQFVDLGGPWLGAVGVTLFAVSLLYVPATLDPEASPGVSWLLVASRLLSAAYWASVARQPDRAAFWAYFATDLGFGVVLGALLQAGLAPEGRISGASLARFARALFAAVTMHARPRVQQALAAVAAVVVAWTGYVGWVYFVRQVPDADFASPEERFKYGAIGLGPASRIPYYVWQVMPAICADAAGAAGAPGGDGWASFGFLYEPGHDTPIGLARREIGYPTLEPNCSLCHTGSYRPDAAGVPRVLPGAPAHELDLERFQRFLYSCSSDARFTGRAVTNAIEARHPLGLVERFMYEFAIVPTMKFTLARQARDYAWQLSRPEQGRGRTDTFNPTKINVFHFADDGTIGTTDLPAVWNQAVREHLWLHWDGNNNEIRERNFAAAMAVGATPMSVDTASFAKVTDYLLTLPPAAYPFSVDAAKAARGQVAYQRECASCHSFAGASVGQVTAVGLVGTDAHRLDSFTAQLVSYFHEVDIGPFRFDAYRKTNGYSNLPLDGVWARAPYLHHGAVPTLRDLLKPPSLRPRVFFRGYNVYDPVNVGFVSQGPEAESHGFRFDTSVPGNDNGGHPYGTQLPPADRDDLVEYMKTL